MKKYLVQDYMKKKVVSLTADQTVKEALKAMIEHKTNGLVVIDKNSKVVGILSSWDIIAYLVPDYLEEDGHLASFESGDVFEERIKEVQDDPVSKFMSAHVHTINPDDSLMQAATLLSEFHIRQLPVVDEDDLLIGYLNRTDIKRALGEILNIKE